MIQRTVAVCLIALIQILLSACESAGEGQEYSQSSNSKGEYIYRMHDEFLFNPPVPEPKPLPIYPWKDRTAGEFPLITKYHFRCKGSSKNPPKKIDQNSEVRHIIDCNGSSGHSLTLKDGKEYIYPILIDLLNYVQNKTGKRVIITSGHRCPDHHLYVDHSKEQMYSKHMVGAEVDFYLEGMEDQPQIAISLIQEYFQIQPSYNGQKEYQQFERWDKPNNDVSTQPWYNKEVFIKLYKKNEGRNMDNSHPYPYISVQVRYDRDTNERVVYSWDKAFRNFHRY